MTLLYYAGEGGPCCVGLSDLMLNVRRGGG